MIMVHNIYENDIIKHTIYSDDMLIIEARGVYLTLF